MAPDGSFRKRKEDPAAVLPVAAFCLGASRMADYASDLRKTRRWLRDYAVTAKGGIREVADPKSPTRNDLAGWVILAWLGSDPHPFGHAPATPAHPAGIGP